MNDGHTHKCPSRPYADAGANRCQVPSPKTSLLLISNFESLLACLLESFSQSFSRHQLLRIYSVSQAYRGVIQTTSSYSRRGPIGQRPSRPSIAHDEVRSGGGRPSFFDARAKLFVLDNNEIHQWTIGSNFVSHFATMMSLHQPPRCNDNHSASVLVGWRPYTLPVFICQG